MGRRRLVNQERVRAFARKLGEWDWRALRSMNAKENASRFGNELRDLYYASFPEVDCKKEKRDVEKPWLDDPNFKQLVGEKDDLNSRRRRGRLSEEGEARYGEVCREVNDARRWLRRTYFDQRVREAEGDARASWEVLREVIGRGKGRKGWAPCGYFRKDGVGVTDSGGIAAVLFTKVGPRLAARVRRERGGFPGILG